eukprot:Pompholyxophrys_sp_v1_NODE_1_length_32789_cov_6.460653.p21 type:complete len:204 gc:universal NODE_1_length_32789_cov_6.460653:31841-31230(-)
MKTTVQNTDQLASEASRSYRGDLGTGLSPNQFKRKFSYQDFMRKSLYDKSFSKEMNAIAFDIYCKNITKTYRGETRNEIYRVCLHLAEIGKEPKDIIYIHDIWTNAQIKPNVAKPLGLISKTNLLPRAIRLLIPHVKSRLSEALRHKRIEKIAYHIAEFSNFNKDPMQCWSEAEKIYESDMVKHIDIYTGLRMSDTNNIELIV